MFERYTEAARKSVFFARFEASAAGSSEIDVTHLLLGILRGDEELAVRLVGAPEKIEAIRQRIFEQSPAKPSTSTTADMPLSHQAKRALSNAAEEAEKLKHSHIGAVHLLLGLARDKDSPAAVLIRELGVSMKKLREESVVPIRPPQRPKPAEADLDPLIGRKEETDRIVQILLRRRKNWVALVGEAGVGKTAILKGLAQRGAGSRTVMVIDALQPVRTEEFGASIVLCVDGLFDLPPDNATQTMSMLYPWAVGSNVQIIATGSPEGFRRLADNLGRYFERVDVLPPTEAGAIEILTGIKEKYESFHGVTIAEDAIRAAVLLSRRFVSRRLLPDRAIDLLDDACVRVRLEGRTEVAVQDIEAAAAERIGVKVLPPEETQH